MSGAVAASADPVLAALARLHDTCQRTEAARRRAEAAWAALDADGVNCNALEATYQSERAEEDAALAAIFETQATTPAGAAALIRFAADHLDEIGLNDSLLVDSFTNAIRAAGDLLERSARMRSRRRRSRVEARRILWKGLAALLRVSAAAYRARACLSRGAAAFLEWLARRL